MRFAVYQPPAALRGERVPVLYYLAGLSCTEETFAIKSGAQRVAAELGLALVSCDTSPRATRFPGDDAADDFGLGAGFYLDATEAPWSTAYKMYSYVTRDLREVVESNFPVDGARRGIFGHSMGGHGALVIALRNPGAYGSVSAFAPIATPSAVPWGEKAFTGYLGAGPRGVAAMGRHRAGARRPPLRRVDPGRPGDGRSVSNEAAPPRAVRGRLRRGGPAAGARPPRRLRPRLLLHQQLHGAPPALAPRTADGAANGDLIPNASSVGSHVPAVVVGAPLGQIRHPTAWAADPRPPVLRMSCEDLYGNVDNVDNVERNHARHRPA